MLSGVGATYSQPHLHPLRRNGVYSLARRPLYRRRPLGYAIYDTREL